MTEAIVTRNGQVTLSKEIRDQLGINEGDHVIVNLIHDAILISKKDPTVWDNIESFLPDNFEKILKEIRGDTVNRFKRLGITSD